MLLWHSLSFPLTISTFNLYATVSGPTSDKIVLSFTDIVFCLCIASVWILDRQVSPVQSYVGNLIYRLFSFLVIS